MPRTPPPMPPLPRHRRSTMPRPRSNCSRPRSRRCRNRSPRSRPRRPRSRRRGRARPNWRTRKPAGASRSAAVFSMTSAMSPIRMTIPTAALRPATWASTTAPAASGLAPKARSRADSATSAKWTSPMPASVSATVILSYTPTNAPFNVAIGNQETNNGLEQISSSRWSSFIERAAFDDAFINTRRLGINLGYVNAAGDFRINGGLWTNHSIDFEPGPERLDRRGARSLCAADGRQPAALRPELPAPRVLGEQRQQCASTAVGAPSTNQLARYRARPFSQLTDVALRRYRQLRRQERRHHRPGSRRHLQVAARRGRGPVSQVQRL